MARPVFIICSQSQASDQLTNFLSLFHVIEGFAVVPISAESAAGERLPDAALAGPTYSGDVSFFVNAVWMKGEDDSEDVDYEFELRIHNPGEETRIAKQGVFQFAAQFYRFNTFVRKLTPYTAGGICEVEYRIRRKGAEEWSAQNFPIPITIQDSPADPE